MDSDGLYMVGSSEEFQLKTSRIFQKHIPDIPLRFFEEGDHIVDLFSSRQTNQFPALIIVVVNKVGVDAIKILKRLKNPDNTYPEYLKGIPVIILVGEENNPGITACYRAGANAVLYKSEDVEKLTRTFQSICDFWIDINRGPEFGRQGML